MNRRETQARKTYQDAQRAVIKACEDLREAEMFLDSFERSERSAAGAGAAARAVSSADIANTPCVEHSRVCGGRRCCGVSRSRGAAGARVTSPVALRNNRESAHD